MERLSISSIFKDAIIQNKFISIVVVLVAILFIYIDKFFIQKTVFNILKNINNIEAAKKYIIYLALVYLISTVIYSIIEYRALKVADKLSNILLDRMTNIVYEKYEEDLRGMEPQLLTTYFEKLNKILIDLVFNNKFRKLPIVILPTILISYSFYLNFRLGLLSFLSILIIVYLNYKLIKSSFNIGIQNEISKNIFLSNFGDYINNLVSIYNNGTRQLEINNLEKNNEKNQNETMFFYYSLYSKKIGEMIISIIILVSLIYLIIYKFTDISLDNKKNLIIFIMSILLELHYSTNTIMPAIKDISAFKAISQKFETLPRNETPNKLDVVNSYDINIVGLGYETVLDQLDLKIPYGQRVAIMGKIGCGKSTTIKLIMKFVKSDAGAIFLGDTNIDDININKYRAIVSYIPQHINLFNRSIEENLFYGSIISAEEKAAIIEKYNVRSFFGDDLSRNVGNNGAKLSGGQRQMLYILRNIIQPFRKIFILDEPTVSLDMNSKKYLINLLDSIQDKTLIIITHDDDILKILDRIIMMDSGKIVEDETI